MDNLLKKEMEARKQFMMQNQQQWLLLQQIQRQRDAISRFPSNIEAHFRPQQALLHQRSSPRIPNHYHPNRNPNPISANNAAANLQQHQHFNACLRMANQDALRVCRPDFKRPFSSLEDACERLLPYHVVGDHEAEEDDKILHSDTTGQVFSRSQQWDRSIAAMVWEFTATFEKLVLAFNILSRKRGNGEFRTEEKLMMEQYLIQDEKRAAFALRAEMDSRQRVNMRMASAMVQEQHAHAEMMSRVPVRASARGSTCSMSASGRGQGYQ